jgi:hypothetical protein
MGRKMLWTIEGYEPKIYLEEWRKATSSVRKANPHSGFERGTTGFDIITLDFLSVSTIKKTTVQLNDSPESIIKYEGVSKSFRTESITKYTLTTINTC